MPIPASRSGHVHSHPVAQAQRPRQRQAGPRAEEVAEFAESTSANAGHTRSQLHRVPARPAAPATANAIESVDCSTDQVACGSRGTGSQPSAERAVVTSTMLGRKNSPRRDVSNALPTSQPSHSSHSSHSSSLAHPPVVVAAPPHSAMSAMSNAEARKHKRIAKQHVTRRKPLPTTTTPASLPASSEDCVTLHERAMNQLNVERTTVEGLVRLALRKILPAMAAPLPLPLPLPLSVPAASPVHSSPSSPSAFAPPAASAPPAPRPASEAPLLRTVLINNSLKLACRQRHELDRREYDQRTLFLQQLSQQRAALLNPGLNTPASNNTNQIICSPMMLLATPPPLPSSDGDCLSNSSSSSSSSSSNNSDSSDNEFDEVASTSDQGNSCPQSPSPLTAMVEEGKTTLASQCLLPQPSLLSSSLTVSGFGAIA